jgi:hypothetical protein
MPLGWELMPCTEESCEGGFFGISNRHFHCIFRCLLQIAAPFAGSVIKFENQASIMASAIPSASVPGESTVAPEERGTGGRCHHAEWPQVAAAVIAAAMRSSLPLFALNDQLVRQDERYILHPLARPSGWRTENEAAHTRRA